MIVLRLGLTEGGGDAPAHGHDDAQCREGLLDMRQTRCKPRLRRSRTRCGEDARLTAIAEGQREDGAGQLTIEHHRADIVLHRGEDQVQLDNLQGARSML